MTLHGMSASGIRGRSESNGRLSGVEGRDDMAAVNPAIVALPEAKSTAPTAAVDLHHRPAP
jgi:hypothetical protein